MKATTRFVRVTAVPVLALVLATAHAASPAPANPYVEECGSCHLAYPANLMPKADWSRVLGQLDRHFGVDASLDAATLQAVATRLDAPTPLATVGPQAATPPRISTQPWFRKEHRDVAAKFPSPAVKSAANCSACHAGAERGVFEDAEENTGRGHDHD